MASQNTWDRLQMLVVDFFRVEPEEVGPEMRFRLDLGADSLTFAEFLMVIEDTFEVKISDHMGDGIQTLADARDCIESLRRTA